MENPFINYKIEKKKTSERAEIIKSIYGIYSSIGQREFRKRENWKRYCQWCRDNKLPNSKENQNKFKKSRQFIKEHKVTSFCYFIHHIPTADLYYVLSIAKDMEHRNQNFSSYLFSSIKVK